MVQQRCEPCFPVLSCSLTDPLQRTGQTFLAQCPGLVALGRVSLGPISSLDAELADANRETLTADAIEKYGAAAPETSVAGATVDEPAATTPRIQNAFCQFLECRISSNCCVMLVIRTIP
jgi:hypothetical protein